MGMVAEPMSLSALATLSGRDRRTVAKKLANIAPVSKSGKIKLYNPPEALSAIFIGGEDGEKLDLSYQSARHKKAQADKTEMEVSVLRGTLISGETVRAEWADLVSAFRAKLLAMPTYLSARLVGLTLRQIEQEIKDAVYQALEELVEIGNASHRESVGRDQVGDVQLDGATAGPKN